MSKLTIKSLTEQLETGEKQYQVLRKEKNAIQSLLDTANAKVAELMNEVEQRKNDFSYLEEKYLSLSEAHTNLNAENHSLRKEIERTNRHINLAENVIHEAKEQQPLVVNHYHNCTINK